MRVFIQCWLWRTVISLQDLEKLIQQKKYIIKGIRGMTQALSVCLCVPEKKSYIQPHSGHTLSSPHTLGIPRNINISNVGHTLYWDPHPEKPLKTWASKNYWPLERQPTRCVKIKGMTPPYSLTTSRKHTAKNTHNLSPPHSLLFLSIASIYINLSIYLHHTIYLYLSISVFLHQGNTHIIKSGTTRNGKA